MIPFGEFAPDAVDLNQNVATVANNVLPGPGKYLPILDISSQSNALTAACQGATTMEDAAGNNYTYAGDATRLYSISGVTVTDESQAGLYTSNSEYWNFVKFDEQVIAAKYGDTPQVLTLGSSTFADLGGTPPQCRTMAVIRDFVVMGNTYDTTDGDQPNRVWWSGFQDETGWTPGTNQSDKRNLEGVGGKVQAIVGGEYGLVMMESSIWRMDYVGVPTIWEFNEIEPGRGTPSPKSVVKQGSDVYYVGQDGFYVIKDGTTSVPIGAGKVDTWFADNVNTGYYENIIGAVDNARSLIVWAFPSDDSATGVPDRLIIYSYKYQRWATATVDTQFIYSGATTALTLEDLDAYGTLDTLEASLDSAIWQGGVLQLSAFDTSNRLSFFTGSTLAGVIETGEFGEVSHETQITEIIGVVDGTYTLQLGTRDGFDDTVSWGSAVSPNSDNKVCDFRSVARYNRVRMTTSGNFTEALGIQPNQKRRGVR